VDPAKKATIVHELKVRIAKMQSMQRQFGKLLTKAPGDNAKVSVLLTDYEDADNVLAKVICSSHAPIRYILLF
jgi:hypothetical protein